MKRIVKNLRESNTALERIAKQLRESINILEAPMDMHHRRALRTLGPEEYGKLLDKNPDAVAKKIGGMGHENGGAAARVYDHERPNRSARVIILRITGSDKGLLKFITFSKQAHSTNAPWAKHFPEFGPLLKADGGYAITAPRFKIIPESDWFSASFDVAKNRDPMGKRTELVINDPSDYLNRVGQRQSLELALNKLCLFMHWTHKIQISWDLNESSFMLRDNGTIVITDPVF